MAIKLAHVGIAVKDLQQALPFYHEVLGIQEGGISDMPSEGMKMAFLHLGESSLELMEPLSPDTNIGRFLEKRGEGIHHLAIRVDDIGAALARAKEAGYQLIDQEPRPGAGGTKVAFIHPKSTNGVLMELVEGEAHH